MPDLHAQAQSIGSGGGHHIYFPIDWKTKWDLNQTNLFVSSHSTPFALGTSNVLGGEMTFGNSKEERAGEEIGKSTPQKSL